MPATANVIIRKLLWICRINLEKVLRTLFSIHSFGRFCSLRWRKSQLFLLVFSLKLLQLFYCFNVNDNREQQKQNMSTRPTTCEKQKQLVLAVCNVARQCHVTGSDAINMACWCSLILDDCIFKTGVCNFIWAGGSQTTWIFKNCHWKKIIWGSKCR